MTRLVKINDQWINPDNVNAIAARATPYMGFEYQIIAEMVGGTTIVIERIGWQTRLFGEYPQPHAMEVARSHIERRTETIAHELMAP